MYSHVKHQHTPHKHVCPQDGCSQSFAYESELDLHVSTHKESLIFCCPSKPCSAVCSTSKAIKAHVRRQHSHKKTYQCAQCNYHSENQASLNNHIRSKHGSSWDCAKCFCHFDFQTGFYCHVRKCIGLKEKKQGCRFPLLL